ncbi:MAG: winged helix-turn-helix domain-containing protein [Comamonas sp.]|uniref:winged helix-turn-helix domain-containing protein n=1 Tax=Comamonas sp. lk TaxID=2201272 RepID=UPI000EB1062D|nr:winged helix-turn-helix domain-containing protein [Comamonas sp. lk]
MHPFAAATQVLHSSSAHHGESGHAAKGFRFAGWELHTRSRKLRSCDGQEVGLTKTEYALLLILLKHPRKIMSRDSIMDMTQAEDKTYDRAIDVQILRLRRKIESRKGAPVLLKTKRSAGYFLDTEVQPLD